MTSKPTEAGMWLVKTMESDYEWEPVIITNSPHGLMVDCPHTGRYLLDHYHNGLSDVEWKRPFIHRNPPTPLHHEVFTTSLPMR